MHVDVHAHVHVDVHVDVHVGVSGPEERWVPEDRISRTVHGNFSSVYPLAFNALIDRCTVCDTGTGAYAVWLTSCHEL